MQANPYSWNKFANVLYIDSPAGTGFTYATDPNDLHTNDFSVSVDIMSFLFQFMRIYPTYVAGKTKLDTQPSVYLFGESYGGTVVTNLAGLLLKMPQVCTLRLKKNSIFGNILHPHFLPINVI